MPRQGLSTSFAIAALALPSPLVAGDRPDPGVLRADDGEYVSVSTSGGWAPTFRVLRSADLRTWRVSASVFKRPPRWAQSGFWAPEMSRLGTGYVLVYNALPRDSRRSYCLGAATAPTPEGPWRDLGRPLRCGEDGSIDPHVTRDERGRLHLLWKADGNEFDRPSVIYAQRLSEDARRLLGKPRELIRNDKRWERRVVEAPTVIRRPDGFFYMLYSANLCCTKRCQYSVGVARSRRLLGPWRKFSGNPILRTGNGWRCPGHTGVTDDGAGGLLALFHGYRAGEERLAGRQLLAAPLTFRPDGWPAIGEGVPPAPAPGAVAASFEDDFTTALDDNWEWPLERVPGMDTGEGLRLSSPRVVRRRIGGTRRPERPLRVDAAVLSRRLSVASYTATTVVDTEAMGRRTRAGISAYRNSFEAIGVFVGRGEVVVWRLRRGRFKVLHTERAPSSALAHLRMVARGKRFSFEASPDGESWRDLGPTVTAPLEESSRLALTVGGERRAKARFVSASLADLREPGVR
ncbi:MAG: family 43 glycosylhydrolase [Thermoleophilaceae bacterium]